jgi:hypothetical protein
MEVKKEVMRYAQDDSLVCRKHLSTSERTEQRVQSKLVCSAESRRTKAGRQASLLP